MQMAPSASFFSQSSAAPDTNTDPGPPSTVLSFPVSFYLTAPDHSSLGSLSDRHAVHTCIDEQCTNRLFSPLPRALPSTPLLSVLQGERWKRQSSHPGALYHLPSPWISAAPSSILCRGPTFCCRSLLEGQGWRREGVVHTVLMTPLSDSLLKALVREMSGSEASDVPVKVSATLVSGSNSEVLDLQQNTNGIGQVSISIKVPPTITELRLLVVLLSGLGTGLGTGLGRGLGRGLGTGLGTGRVHELFPECFWWSLGEGMAYLGPWHRPCPSCLLSRCLRAPSTQL